MSDILVINQPIFKVLIKILLICIAFDLSKTVGQELSAEKALIKPNKTVYLVGDTIYFSAFVINYRSYKLSTLSEILYIDLWNDDKKFLTQKIVLENGRGYGAIAIPKEIVSGSVSLIAYTQWMQNFPNLSYNQTHVYVHNPAQLLVEDLENSEAQIAFFPEGGQLVPNQINKLVANTSDKRFYGKELLLISVSSDTISDIAFDELGMAEFRMVPDTAFQYFASFEGDSIALKFPLISDKSAALKLIEREQKLILFANFGQNFKADALELIVQSKGVIISQQSLKYEGFRRVQFDFVDLPAGLIQFVLLDAKGRLLSERLYHKTVAMTSQDVMITNSKNPLFINNKYDFGISSDSSYYSGVVLLEKQIEFGDGNVFDLTLQRDIFSEIGVSILSDNFLNALGDDDFKDRFLVTQRIKTFKFNEEGNVSNERYRIAERSNRFILEGKIFDLSLKRSIKDAEFLCVVSGQKKLVYKFNTNEEGKFYIPIESFLGSARLTFKLLSDESKNKIDVLLYKPAIEKPSAREIIAFDQDEIFKSYIKNAVELATIEKTYCEEEIINTSQAKKRAGNSYFSNYTFELDYSKYIILNNFGEILKELVPAVKLLRKVDSTNMLRLYTHMREEGFMEQIFDGAPLILLDGVPIDNHKIVMNLSPKEVKNIRTINNQLLINGSIFSGLLEIETNSQKILNIDLDGISIIAYEGFQEAKSHIHFSSCTADQLNAENFPDFRNQLLWVPELTIGKSKNGILNFVTPSEEGLYSIKVELISQKGQIIELNNELNIHDNN